MENLEKYLAAGEFIDSGDAGVRAFAEKAAAGAGDEVTRAVRLYNAVRDEVLYDPYYAGEEPSYFRASDCLRAKRGFCIPKAALLAAAARAVGIPARVGYADVRNHLATKRLIELIGSDVFLWHSYTELFLGERWVKATPAFNLSLCKRFGVRPLEFNGRDDSLFHEYADGGRRHMEYVQDRGCYPDVPYEMIVGEFRKLYPRWMSYVTSNGKGDFSKEA
jgi:transglutaminase-like putative cysteine protease